MGTLIQTTFEKILVKDFNFQATIDIDNESTIEKCLEVFEETKAAVLVVNSIGIITRNDIFKFLAWDNLALFQKPIASLVKFRFISIGLNDSLWDAIQVISKQNIRYLPIIKGNKIVGVIDLFLLLEIIVSSNKVFFDQLPPIVECFKTDAQNDEKIFSKFLTKNFENIFTQKISHVTSLYQKVLTIDINEKPIEIYNKMKLSNIKNAIVVEYGISIVGIMSENDILKKILFRKAFNITTTDLITHNPHRLRQIHTVGNAIKNMHYFKYRAMLLVDEDDYPINLITVVDIFNYMVNIWAN